MRCVNNLKGVGLMSSIEKIDTNKMKEIVLEQKKINKEMCDLFIKIKNNGNSLKDYWDTRASKVVYDDLEQLYNTFDKVLSCNDEYTKFLENITISGYENTENNINNTIDNNIAI